MREGMENESDENNESDEESNEEPKEEEEKESEEGKTETVEATEPKHKLVVKMLIMKAVNNALSYENDIRTVTH